MRTNEILYSRYNIKYNNFFIYRLTAIVATKVQTTESFLNFSFMKSKMLLLALGVVLMANGCKSRDNNKEEETIYSVSTPEQTNTSISKDYVAQIQSLKNIEIRAQQHGLLQEVLVEEGQTVKAGQVLFRLTPMGSAEEVDKAKAEVEQARIELENVTTLAAGNVVSKNAKAMARAKLDAAVADLRLSQLHLKMSTIRAPFSGIIDRIPKKKGSIVEEGDLLTSLSDNSSVYAYFNLSEPEYLDYQSHAVERQKDPLDLILANGASLGKPGFIQNIGGEFNNETGSISLRAKFPNSNGLLRNGQTGKVRMTIPVTKALLIPQKSTYEVQDKTYVFVVDNKNVVHARAITIAYEMPGVFVISQGLGVGEKFIVDGVQKVNDGDKIKISFESPEKVMQSLSLKAN